MSDDRISLDFLGEQTCLRADFRRLEAKVDGLDTKVDGLDAKEDRLAAPVDAGFEQVNQTAATDLQILLNAIAANRG